MHTSDVNTNNKLQFVYRIHVNYTFSLSLILIKPTCLYTGWSKKTGATLHFFKYLENYKR